MIKHLLLGLLIISAPGLGQTAPHTPEINVIYGNRHIYTVETPPGWINDRELASSIGLVSFFYAVSDSSQNPKSYFYTMGYDKDVNQGDLKAFIRADLKTFREKYPDLTFQKIDIIPSGDILSAEMYSFNNLSDRYKEEVVYMETETSVFVFSFAAFNKQDYLNYQPVFNQFLTSFKYRGNDPGPYLEWLKKRKQAMPGQP